MLVIDALPLEIATAFEAGEPGAWPWRDPGGTKSLGYVSIVGDVKRVYIYSICIICNQIYLMFFWNTSWNIEYRSKHNSGPVVSNIFVVCNMEIKLSNMGIKWCASIQG